MEKRRNCASVIAQMIEKIPVQKEALLKDLAWNLEDATYKAPEETIQWQRTMETLQKHINPPSAEWEWKVLSIFTTHSIEELKKSFDKVQNQKP